MLDNDLTDFDLEELEEMKPEEFIKSLLSFIDSYRKSKKKATYFNM